MHDTWRDQLPGVPSAGRLRTASNRSVPIGLANVLAWPVPSSDAARIETSCSRESAGGSAHANCSDAGLPSTAGFGLMLNTSTSAPALVPDARHALSAASSIASAAAELCAHR